jgi:predicted nucleotidyltransferase
MYKPKLTILQNGILRFLFINAGVSFNARGLAMALKVSQPAVSKALPALRKEGFVKVNKDKDSKRLSIELNRDNPLIIWLKRADNLRQIYESGLVNYFYDNFPGATIILFGSYSLGEDTPSSDIDISIIGSKERRLDLEQFRKDLGRSIVINYYESFHVMDKHLRNNILSGIVLKGAVEL